MLNIYYKRPILYDYFISILVIIILCLLRRYCIFEFPKIEKSLEFASDIAGVGLTISGFILTLLTILMTLKSGEIVSDEKPLKNSSSAFKIFLSSPLYLESVKILRNGVFSLLIICFLIYLNKLLFTLIYSEIIFFMNITCLILIVTTFFRCFYVLDLIGKMQKPHKD